MIFLLFALGAFFADYKEYHTDTNVDFNVTIVEDKLKVNLFV